MQLFNVKSPNPSIVQADAPKSNPNTLKTTDFQYINYKEEDKKKDVICSSDVFTTTKLSAKKFKNALTRYTVKGFTGNRDANFYEFLAMGMIPYMIGSGMLIALFNGVNHVLPPADRRFASKLGLQAGLGVVFYGLARHFSKRFVETPVAMATGVDMNLPCKTRVKETPTKTNSDPEREEIHYAYESVEFPRTDLMFNYSGDVSNVNEKFDKITRKLGYSEKLPDSDQIAKPKIREISTKTMAVTYITKYMWAALGVAYAAQSPWERLLDRTSETPVNKSAKNFFQKTKTKLKSLGQVMIDSAKELYNGSVTGGKAEHISGKALVLTTLFATVAGTAWVILSSKNKNKPMPEKYNIDKTKDYSVS